VDVVWMHKIQQKWRN